jgi:hypothetical protein
MTTIRQIVIDAYREAGITPVGETPDADEFDEGLRRLQSIIKSLYGNELGDPLQSYNYGTTGVIHNYGSGSDVSSEVDSLYIPQNTRLVFNVSVSKTIYLNPNPQAGARFGIIDNAQSFAANPITLNGNGRRVDGALTEVLNTNGLASDWFYRDDTGSWTKVTDLTASDDHPFPEEFDDFLTTKLALRINPRMGAQTPAEMVEVLKEGARKFRARYHQIVQPDAEYGLVLLPSNYYARSFAFTNFNKGRI